MPKRNERDIPTPQKINGQLLGIYVNGGRKTFGNYNDPAAWEKFTDFCKNWQSNKPTQNYPKISELVDAFIPYAKEHKPNDWYNYRIACKVLLKYADLTTDEFDSCLLLQLQNDFLAADYNRHNCNRYVNHIVHVFRWGEPRRLVPPGKYLQLKAIAPLLPGTGREPIEREDVPYEVVERTLPYLLPVYQAFIRILMLTGARPSEILRMKIADIERRQTEIWVFSPKHHKTARKNKRRIIAFREREQTILAPYMAEKDINSVIFTPQDAIVEHYTRRHAEKVPPVALLARLTPQFRTVVISQALRLAIRRANRELPPDQQIPRWTLYQIRHTFATQAALRLGDEAAALLLGHSNPTMLRKRYDHSQELRITEFKKRLEQ